MELGNLATVSMNARRAAREGEDDPSQWALP